MLNSIKFGLELYDRYKKDNSLKKALYDNLKRELYFNIEIIDNKKLKDKRFENWISKIKNDVELIEKIYLKITILKELSSVNIRKVSYKYLKFLLIILKRHLNSLESK